LRKGGEKIYGMWHPSARRKDERREARREKREEKSEKREEKSEKREERREKREKRNQIARCYKYLSS
jgi:hypothetical protein